MADDTTWLGIDLGASSAKLALLHAPAPLAGGLRTPDLGACLDAARPASVGRRLGVHGQSARYTRPTLEGLGAALHEAVIALLKGAEGAGGAGPVAVAGVGLAVPGPVGAGGVVVQCGNLPALDAVDGVAWLREALTGVIDGDLPVRVLTDASAAAAGAWSADPRPGRSLYLSLGTGVGGAVLDDGQPLTFTRGTPGHLGHLDISGGDPDAPSTPAAGRGAWEAYLGAPALRAAGLPLDDPARCADHPAMDGALNALARGLRITLALYRMDHIVLLGGVAPIFAPHLDTLKHRIADGLTAVAPDTWTLGIGETGLHTAAIGAACLALHHHR